MTKRMRFTSFSAVVAALGLAVAGLAAPVAQAANPVITFDLGGAPGTPPAAVTVTDQGTAAVPAAPTWPDHVFAGWYKSAGNTAVARGDAPNTAGGGFLVA
ncbi:MAG: InlB B-repeat-containing protein [Bifidobacteriaceae bacterium]|jgi:hypothetical protein|nr:InlB B-repeat-containing protein [Bifidobacteriaceae bacterium]